MAGRGSLGLCFARGVVAALLLMIKLQVLQALGQGQLLLDGHTQQRVQGLLLILSSEQLPLHVIQLGHILITPDGKREGGKGRDTLFPAGGAICLELLLPHVFSISQKAFSRWEEDLC